MNDDYGYFKLAHVRARCNVVRLDLAGPGDRVCSKISSIRHRTYFTFNERKKYASDIETCFFSFCFAGGRRRRIEEETINGVSHHQRYLPRLGIDARSSRCRLVTRALC